MLAYQIVGARNEAESAGFQHTGMLLVEQLLLLL